MSHAVPELRFPEFRNGWEIQPLGNFLKVHREKSTKPNQHEVMTSARHGLVRQRDYYGEGRIVERENVGFNVIPPNFMTYRSRSDDRRFFFNENCSGETGIVSVYYPVFRVANGSNTFFVELLKSKQHFVGRFSVGTSQTVLSFNELTRIKLPVPEAIEQAKIAGFLDAVTTKIVLLGREKEALEAFKRGTMQRLFTREIRFTRFDGSAFPEWEERKLGEVVDFFKGKGISKAAIVENGATPCIRYGEIYTHYGERIHDVISSTDADRDRLFLSESGDVIIPASGEDRLDMARACCVEDEGVALGGDINVLRSPVNGEFLAYYLNNARRREIASLGQGNAVVHLYPAQLKTLTVEIPHPDEQRKIADALGAIDAKIDAVGAQITQMETFKRGLLQKMFV